VLYNKMNYKKIIIAILLFPSLIFAHVRIGLALGGGSARGLAHIGVLKALEENHIPIDVVGGTSMGAIVGALWASGYSATEIESIFVNTNVQDWFLNIPIIKNRPIYYDMNSYPTLVNLEIKNGKFQLPQSIVDDRVLNFEVFRFFSEADLAIKGDFRNLWKPYLCTASDINSNKSVIFTHGKLEDAVRASMAIPVVFKPVKLGDTILFDGGLYDNIPTEAIKDSFNADYIISVDVSSDKKNLESNNINLLNIGFSLVDLLTKSINPDSLKGYGCYIRPEVGKFKGSEFDKVKTLIQLGYDAAMKAMPELKREISRREYYGSERKKKIKNFTYFDSCNVNSLRMNVKNKFQFVIMDNVLKLNSGKRFSFEKLQNGVFKLYSMDMFGRISTYVTMNDSDELNIKIDAQTQESRKLGIGGFYDSNGGVNLIGKFQNSNFFDRGGQFNVYGFIGNYLKGTSVDLIFPTLFYTKYISSLSINYLIYKFNNIWSNYYFYSTFYNMNLLSGYNINNNSMISFVLGNKYLGFLNTNFFKYYAGFYYIFNSMNRFEFNDGGCRINAYIGFNLPDKNGIPYQIKSVKIEDTYGKMIFNYLKSFKISETLNTRIVSNVGIISHLYPGQVLDSNVIADYSYVLPSHSYKFMYDRSFTAKYSGTIGIAIRYYLNKILYLQNKNCVSLLSNSFSSFVPSYIYSTDLNFGFKNLFGEFQAGIEYLYVTNNPNGNHKFSFYISIGNNLESIDVINEF